MRLIMDKFNNIITSKSYSNKLNIEVLIAKIYLYCLPIRMISQFTFLKEIFHGAAIYFDFIVSIIGIFFIILMHKKIKIKNNIENNTIIYILKCVLFLNIMSIVMAFYIQLTYGNYQGSTAFSGVMGMIIYFFQYVVMIIYNKYIFEIIPKQEMLKILNRTCFFLLILGYIQIINILTSNALLNLIRSVDVFDILMPSQNIKLSLTTLEGASAGMLISIFVLPILLSQFTIKKQMKLLFQIIAWIPVIYFTKSSTSYILSIATFSTFFMYIFKENINKNKILKILIIAVIIIIFCSLIYIDLPKETKDDISYLLFYKLSDQQNGSSVSRYIPFYTNIGVFKQFPLFGVGNGLQGYFFIDYFPMHLINTAGSDIKSFYNVGANSIANGGLFFPSILSGYGILGVGIIFTCMIKIKRLIAYKEKENNIFYYAFKYSVLAIIIAGFQGDFYGLYYLWFMISLPFMNKELNEKF